MIFGGKILDRYIGRTVLSWIIYISLFLCTVSWLIKFMEQLKNVGNEGYTIVTALKLVTLLVPHNFYTFFPIAALMGTVVGLCMLAKTSELVVMQVSGLSKIRVVWASLKTVLPLMLLVLLIGEYVIPYTEFQYNVIKAKALSGIDLAKGNAYALWVREGQSFVYLSHASADGMMQGIERYQFDPQSMKLTDHAKASEGSFTGTGWELKNVKHEAWLGDKIGFSTVPVESWQLNITPEKFSVFDYSADELSIQALWDYVSYLKKHGAKADKFELEFWRKVLSPFAVVTMILLASSVVFGSIRTLTVGARIALGIVLGFAFYVANQTFSPMSVVYGLPPFLCASLPSFVFFAFALHRLVRNKA